MNYIQQPHPDGPNPMNYFAANTSPLVNPPHRRAFSSFSNDGSPINGIPQGMFSPDDMALYGLDGDDQGDPKRRRIARVRRSSPDAALRLLTRRI
jgi:hypothetical protein